MENKYQASFIMESLCTNIPVNKCIKRLKRNRETDRKRNREREGEIYKAKQ